MIKGQWTKEVKRIEKVVPREIVTSDGEIVTIDNRFYNNMVADITNKVDSLKERRKVKNEYAMLRKSNNLINEVGGNFYHMMYDRILNADLQENYAIRFLLLCTYLDYENNLVVGKTSDRRKIKENELKDILKLSERETIRTKKYLLEQNLITIDDGIISVNKDFAIKGKVKVKDEPYSRVFEEGFKDLYYGVKPVQHKNLYFFIKCLPYLNNKYNILCENPLEKDKDLIKPLSFGELGKIFGMDRKQASNLKNTLFKLKVNDKKVIAELVNLSERRIVVNPAIFYKSNSECISDVARLFETL
ncbi:hypothetical protein FORC3_1207 [Clostridium perfringens]|uniref:hypothetical protein n=1 Tax=Clostridium perfringens TaxID=1502 RepID=UPI0007058939|nr:hypothetical protein [Clostridium perfringens]ALG48584.1 hypothetical protein FORC3_1207 [Clostridium perfringens]